MAAARNRARESEPFGLILIEERLTGGLGRELASALRDQDGSLQSHLVGMAGRDRLEGDIESLGQAGFDAWFERPIRPSRLYRTLAKASVGMRMAERAEPNGVVDAAAREPAEAGAPSLRILLAEDHLINQRLAVALLEKEGHRVEVADNGLLALEAVQDGGFDLVLMDIQMPELDGLEATRRIRALPEPVGRIPIIAMTANAMKGDDQTCLAAGMNDYLPKPIDRGQLTELVLKWGRRNGAAEAPTEQELLSIGSEEPIIAESLLDDLERQLGRDVLVDLVAEQIDDTRRRVKEIGEAIAAGNLQGLSEIVHGLKSTAGNFGLPALSARAAAVEQACRQNHRAAAFSLGDTIERIALKSLDALAARYPESDRAVA
jgi:CheY-like chemotaxis protein